MTTDQILQMATTISNVLCTLLLAVIFLKSQKSKTKAVTTTASILKTIPTYIENAKSLGLTTSTSILNFVMAEIKDDFKEVMTKKTEKQVKKEVEKCAVKQESE